MEQMSECKFPVGISPDAYGYGHKWSKELGYTTTAGKALWIRRYGLDSIPPGHQINHICDTPFCVQDDEEGVYTINGKEFKRLGHLWLGTHQDNMDDMKIKGRSGPPTGLDNPSAYLTDDDVRDVRRALSCGISLRNTADLFNISPSTVSDIKSGRSRSSVK